MAGLCLHREETARSYLAFVQTGLHLFLLKELAVCFAYMAHGLHSVEKYWENQEGSGARFRAGEPVCDMLTEEFVVVGGTQRFG